MLSSRTFRATPLAKPELVRPSIFSHLCIILVLMVRSARSRCLRRPLYVLY